MDKIDFVILWVDGFRSGMAAAEREYSQRRKTIMGTDENRFREWGLLRYWFRGVERYAPWVNRVFLVTNGQVPNWINREHPKLRLVRHEEYIPKRYLPTFNSNVIELWLHQIPDLGEHFVLFNDDMYLTAPVKPEDFFRKGLPCDSAVMDLVTTPGPEDCLPHMQINNFALINRHFNKKKVLRKNMGKFFAPVYGSGPDQKFSFASFSVFFMLSGFPSPFFLFKRNLFSGVGTGRGKVGSMRSPIVSGPNRM